MKAVTVVAEDRDGLLSEISYILGKCSIGIESLAIDVVGPKAIVAMMVRDRRRTSEVLLSNGFRVAEEDTLLVKVPNRPGEIQRFIDTLAGARVNIEKLRRITNDTEHGVFRMMVDKPRKAARMLSSMVLNDVPAALA